MTGNTFEPQREKTYLLTCAPIEDSNQPAHSCSVIRVFIVRMRKHVHLKQPSQRAHDVYTTSSQRRCNVMTLHRRWDDVVSSTSWRCIDVKATLYRRYNVFSTSMQCHDVALTLRRRCIDVTCLLGCILSYPKYAQWRFWSDWTRCKLLILILSWRTYPQVRFLTLRLWLIFYRT